MAARDAGYAVGQRVKHGTVRYRLCADGLDGLGGLPHFRPACRDKVVDTSNSGIHRSDADFDDAESFQRDVARFATNEPRAEDADDAHANEPAGCFDSASPPTAIGSTTKVR
jgi:hypothetical protein